MANTALIGVAGVHHAISELSRRGMIALATVRNVAAYDIVVAAQDGSGHANLQVKTSSKRVAFFPAPHPDRIYPSKFDYYLLLRWSESDANYEGFLLTAKEAKAASQQSVDGQAERGHKIMPCINLSKHSKAAVRWAKRWKEWNI
jgi:hypothetical protein